MCESNLPYFPMLFHSRLLCNKFGAQHHECGCSAGRRVGGHLCNKFNIREGWHFYVHGQTERIRGMQQLHILHSVRRATNILKNSTTASFLDNDMKCINQHLDFPPLATLVNIWPCYNTLIPSSDVVLALENATPSHR